MADDVARVVSQRSSWVVKGTFSTFSSALLVDGHQNILNHQPMFADVRASRTTRDMAAAHGCLDKKLFKRVVDLRRRYTGD